MPEIDLHENYPMRELTTFKIGGPTRYIIHIHSVNEIVEALRFLHQTQSALFILGGGSNTLVSDREFHGLIVKMSTKGVEVLEEDRDSVVVRVAAGEPWDEFVASANEQGWWGIENLSHIPGDTGALAIQNVGAYGQEAAQAIESLEVCEISTGRRRNFMRDECRFGYRSSIFNSTQRGEYIILNTVFRLQKTARPNLSYQAFRDIFADNSEPELRSIREAVIRIRREKLPEPSEIGSAGSFFKNCVLSRHDFIRCCRKVGKTLGDEAAEQIRSCELRSNSKSDEQRIPTALLLEMCGLQGLQYGGAALYHKHPLIVVNQSGSATAADVMELTRHVRRHVFQRTGIQLRPEPNLLGFSPEELQEYFGV